MIFLNSDEELIWDNGYQVLYFNATWLPLNKKNLFMLQRISKKQPSIKSFVIDTDYFKGLCRRFNISRLPSFVITKNGKEIGRIEENLRTSEFIAFFDDIYSMKQL